MPSAPMRSVVSAASLVASLVVQPTPLMMRGYCGGLHCLFRDV
jgi:hypothetical protein